MRILVRDEGESPDWGHRKQRRRRRRAYAVICVLVALAGVGGFIYVAYQRTQGAKFVVDRLPSPDSVVAVQLPA